MGWSKITAWGLLCERFRRSRTTEHGEIQKDRLNVFNPVVNLASRALDNDFHGSSDMLADRLRGFIAAPHYRGKLSLAVPLLSLPMRFTWMAGVWVGSPFPGPSLKYGNLVVGQFEHRLFFSALMSHNVFAILFDQPSLALPNRLEGGFKLGNSLEVLRKQGDHFIIVDGH